MPRALSFQRDRRHATISLAAGSILAGIALAGGIGDGVFALSPAPVSTPRPPIVTPAPRPPEPRTLEESRQIREKLQREEGNSGRLVPASGPETRGIVIHVAGKPIQLPPDAWIEREITFIQCALGEPCPQAPLYELRRGSSRIVISVPSGDWGHERIAPGEEGAFDFIKGKGR